VKKPQEGAADADVSLMRRSAWAKGAGASPWLAGVRLMTSACGAAWVVWDWDTLPRPALALAGLAVVAVSALFYWWPPVRAKGLAEAVTAGVAALLLVALNGGAGSPLVALWLSVLAGICLALPPLVRVQLPTLLASAAAVGTDPGTTAIPLMLGGGAVAAGSFVVSRRYAHALDRAQLQSLQDPLTGLPNRRALDQRLAVLAATPSPALALLWVDLDGFRHINEDHGYASGDRALVEAAHVLWRAAPPGSFPARLGGDQFAIVLEDRRHARELADLVIHELSGVTIEGTTLGASVGIAYLPEHGPTLDRLRAGAEQALRWAKQRGEGIAVEFDPAKVFEHTPTPDDVRRLWDEDLIDIVVQPIVDIQYGRVLSYEALARFRVDGDPSPLTWFSLAEAQGLRVELELACLERALRLLPARPFGTRLSVNASPELLAHPAARSLLMEVSNPEGVVLEVTENAVVDDYEHLKEILAPLVERGMTLAVDDFGAGASTMRHVDALAPSSLTLVRTLVADIASDPRKSAMVEALVRYTWRTDSQLVAEGVETTADLEHLRRLGVGAAQGFVIARPQPPWPMLELPALALMRQDFAPRGRLGSIVCQSDALTALEARDLFARDAQLTAIALIDGSERVQALLTRNRLLTRAGFVDGPALDLADTDPLLVRPGTARAEIVSLALAREADTRYDPILVVDEAWRLIEALTIEELLQESSAAAQESAAGGEPLRLAAES
jgi:diguanylate cyclase (GGDEF)-like protein